MTTKKLGIQAICGVFATFVGTAADPRVGVLLGLATTALIASGVREPAEATEPIPAGT